MARPKLDEIDRRILTILQADATKSLAEVAAAVGLSQTPCWRRIQRLRADGTIERTVAILKPEAIGLGLTVFISIEAAHHTSEWLDRFTALVDSKPQNCRGASARRRHRLSLEGHRRRYGGL